MPNTLSINEILSEVKKLDKKEQLSLLERLVALICKKGERVKLSQISGIGSSLWAKSNIDEYISQERQW